MLISFKFRNKCVYSGLDMLIFGLYCYIYVRIWTTELSLYMYVLNKSKKKIKLFWFYIYKRNYFDDVTMNVSVTYL